MGDDKELSEEEYKAAVSAAQDTVKESISKYLQTIKQSSLLVTKFCVVAETYQTEDEGTVEAKTLIHFVDNMAPWETHGMLSMVAKDVWQDSYVGSGGYYDDEEE